MSNLVLYNTKQYLYEEWESEGFIFFKVNKSIWTYGMSELQSPSLAEHKSCSDFDFDLAGRQSRAQPRIRHKIASLSTPSYTSADHHLGQPSTRTHTYGTNPSLDLLPCIPARAALALSLLLYIHPPSSSRRWSFRGNWTLTLQCILGRLWSHSTIWRS